MNVRCTYHCLPFISCSFEEAKLKFLCLVQICQLLSILEKFVFHLWLPLLLTQNPSLLVTKCVGVSPQSKQFSLTPAGYPRIQLSAATLRRLRWVPWVKGSILQDCSTPYSRSQSQAQGGITCAFD